jgi:hypothetical protein
MLHHQRETETVTFSKEAIRKDVQLVQDRIRACKATIIKGLKCATLFRYVHKWKMHDHKMGELKFIPNYESRIFSLEQEKMLVEYILNCLEMYCRLSTEQSKWLTHEMVGISYIPYTSNEIS